MPKIKIKQLKKNIVLPLIFNKFELFKVIITNFDINIENIFKRENFQNILDK